jgi:D-lactate dehydrogenase
MIDVYFYEVFEEELRALRQCVGTSFTYAFTEQTVQETGHTEPPARLISIRTQSIIPPSWCTLLDGVLSRSMGYDHLLRYRAEAPKPIPCGYLEEYSARAVAEHAMLLVLSLFRKLPQQMRQFPRFERSGLTGSECQGKRLLVVGVGRIGRHVMEIGAGLGMVVEGVDIVQDKPNVPYISFCDGVGRADAIVSCMNLTDDNVGYFNATSLSEAKRGCVFVNIARGEESPLEDLESLLTSGILGGIGLDVFDQEAALATALRQPRGEASSAASLVQRLLQHPNVIFTPHNAFNSHEAVERKSAMTVEQLVHFLFHRRFLWQIT